MHYLGIEIGGTKLQFGVGHGEGPPLAAFERRAVERAQGADAIRKQIEQVGGELIKAHRIQAVGYGFGGPIDVHRGVVTKSHQVAGWEEFPLVEWTQALFGLPVALGNDCDVAALAEASYGAGRHKQSVFFITVGTGIGGGFVVDGAPFGTTRPAVAEIGHLRPTLRATDPQWTIESLASGPGIVDRVRQRLLPVLAGSPPGNEDTVVIPPDVDVLQRDTTDLLRRCRQDLARLTARDVAEAAAQGNVLATDALGEACRVLGWGIAQMITLLAPETIVIGGGVSLIGEQHFFAPVREATAKYVFPPLVGRYEIVPAALGEDTVVHGAIALARHRFGVE